MIELNNNYYNISYPSLFSSPSPQTHTMMVLSSITSVRKSVDFITISISDAGLRDDLVKILEVGGFRSGHHYRISKGNYNFKWNFHHPDDDITADILYGLKYPSAVIPSIRLKIHDPNREFIDYLTKAFVYRKEEYFLSEIELTFDFFAEDTRKVWDLIVSSLFQYHQRKPSFLYYDSAYGDTFYTTDIRNTRHFGMRVYEKTFSDKTKTARMELVLKADRIRDMGLVLPLDNLDKIPLREFFEFKLFDADRLVNYLHGIGLTEIPNPHPDAPADAEKWVWTFLINSESLMEIAEKLKVHRTVFRNYSRFFRRFEEFQELFESKILGKKFLATREERKACQKT